MLLPEKSDEPLIFLRANVSDPLTSEKEAFSEITCLHASILSPVTSSPSKVSPEKIPILFVQDQDLFASAGIKSC